MEAVRNGRPSCPWLQSEGNNKADARKHHGPGPVPRGKNDLAAATFRILGIGLQVEERNQSREHSAKIQG